MVETAEQMADIVEKGSELHSYQTPRFQICFTNKVEADGSTYSRVPANGEKVIRTVSNHICRHV